MSYMIYGRPSNIYQLELQKLTPSSNNSSSAAAPRLSSSPLSSSPLSPSHSSSTATPSMVSVANNDTGPTDVKGIVEGLQAVLQLGNASSSSSSKRIRSLGEKIYRRLVEELEDVRPKYSLILHIISPMMLRWCLQPKEETIEETITRYLVDKEDEKPNEKISGATTSNTTLNATLVGKNIVKLYIINDLDEGISIPNFKKITDIVKLVLPNLKCLAISDQSYSDPFFSAWNKSTVNDIGIEILRLLKSNPSKIHRITLRGNGAYYCQKEVIGILKLLPEFVHVTIAGHYITGVDGKGCLNADIDGMRDLVTNYIISLNLGGDLSSGILGPGIQETCTFEQYESFRLANQENFRRLQAVQSEVMRVAAEQRSVHLLAVNWLVKNQPQKIVPDVGDIIKRYLEQNIALTPNDSDDNFLSSSSSQSVPSSSSSLSQSAPPPSPPPSSSSSSQNNLPAAEENGGNWGPLGRGPIQ